MHFRTQFGATLAVTPDHPIHSATAGRFEAAGDLVGTVTVLGLSSSSAASEASAESVPALEAEGSDLHNLTVDRLHNCFAAGVRVHDKDRCG